jgi:hypothetical protein
MQAFKGLFVVSVLLAALSVAIVPDSDAQFMCPGNTQYMTFQKQTQVTQYYQQMQMQQQQQQMYQQQMQQMKMQQMQQMQQQQMQQQMAQQQMHAQKQMMPVQKQPMMPGLQQQQMHLMQMQAQAQLKQQHMQFQHLVQGTTQVQYKQHLLWQQHVVLHKTELHSHALPGMVASKTTPQLLHTQHMLQTQHLMHTQQVLHTETMKHTQQTMHTQKSMDLAKMGTDVSKTQQMHKTGISKDCTHLQTATGQQPLQKTGMVAQKTATAINLQQMNIQKNAQIVQKTNVQMQMKPLTKTITETGIIAVSDQNCAHCHQQNKQMIAKGPLALPPMMQQRAQGVPALVGKNPVWLPAPVAKNTMPLPAFVGKEPMPVPQPLLALWPKTMVVPPMIVRQPVPTPPALLALWPQTVVRPPMLIVQQPLTTQLPPMITSPIVVAKVVPTPTLLDKELPAHLRKSTTTKQPQSPGSVTLPTIITDSPAEANLRTPAKLLVEQLWQPLVDEGKVEQPAAGLARLVPLSEEDLQQPPQRKLSPAVVYLTPVIPVAEKLQVGDDVLPAALEMLPTKREPLTPFNVTPVAPAPMRSAVTPPTPTPTLQQPGLPTARNTEFGPG